MELDKRIKIGKTYLDCFDTDTAMQFVGKKCYFGGDVTDFADISKLTCTMLYSVDNSKAPYNYYKDGFLFSAEFILPCAWVEEEPSYRPYTLEEFTKQYSLGDEIILRRKDSRSKILHKLFTAFNESSNNEIKLESYTYGFKDLYKEYELYTSDGWKPFGVEE